MAARTGGVGELTITNYSVGPILAESLDPGPRCSGHGILSTVSWLVRFTDSNRPEADMFHDHAALVASLWDLGSTGMFEAEHGVLVAGFDDRLAAERAADLGNRSGLDATVETMKAEWHNDETTSVVVDTTSGPVTFPVVAGPSFGHGAHPTTQLALDLSSRMQATGRQLGNVLDLGTGSGVLAIAAHHLGAESIVAIDIDQSAVDVARSNLDANQVPSVCRLATAADLAAEKVTFDTVLANVLVSVHESEATNVNRLLANGGAVITSGFLTSQEQRVLQSYQRHRPNLQPAVTHRIDEWVGYLLAED